MIVRELVTVLGFRVSDSAARRYNQRLQSIQKTAKTVVKAVTVMTGASIALGAVLIKGAGEIEQVSIAFETMTGSAEVAAQLLKDITSFAAKTPFQLTGLIENSKKLLAFNFDANEVINTMTNLGNISAGVGRDKLPTLVQAFGKIRVKGKASMEELNMLLEAGVPILDALAEGFDVSTQALFKMITAGKVGFEDVEVAITGLATGTGKFANLMEKQSRSFLGIISNIGDFFKNLSNEIGGALLPAVTELAKKFLSFLEANRELIKTTAVKFFEKLVFAIAFVAGFLTRVIENMGGLETVIKIIGDVIKGIFDFVSDTIKSLGGVAGIIEGIKSVISGVAGFVTNVVDALGGKEAVFEGIKNILSGMVDFVSKLIEKSGGFENFVKIILGLIVAFKLLKLLNMIGIFSGIATGLTGVAATAAGIAGVAVAILGLAAIISSFGEKDPAKQKQNLADLQTGGVRAREEGTELPFARSADLPSLGNRGGGFGGNVVKVDVSSQVALDVPAGTSETQVAAVEEAARLGTRNEWEAITRELIISNPELDFTLSRKR